MHAVLLLSILTTSRLSSSNHLLTCPPAPRQVPLHLLYCLKSHLIRSLPSLNSVAASHCLYDEDKNPCYGTSSVSYHGSLFLLFLPRCHGLQPIPMTGRSQRRTYTYVLFPYRFLCLDYYFPPLFSYTFA